MREALVPLLVILEVVAALSAIGGFLFTSRPRQERLGFAILVWFGVHVMAAGGVVLLFVFAMAAAPFQANRAARHHRYR